MESSPTGTSSSSPPDQPDHRLSFHVKHMDGTSAAAPPTPEVAAAIFGDRLEFAERYVVELADTGITHGLIGPREAPRLWDRHVLGCAVFHPAFPLGATVGDIGSGAGLPGVVLGIVRPDLDIVLVEPLHRRAVWLQSTIEKLELDNVTVHEGRAESLWGVRRFPAVTARAVARMGVLSGWCLPLLEAGGRLVAMKGASAPIEVEEDRAVILAAGGVEVVVSTFGEGYLEVPTTIVTVAVGDAPIVARPSAGARRGSKRPRKQPRSGSTTAAGRVSALEGSTPDGGACLDQET